MYVGEKIQLHLLFLTSSTHMWECCTCWGSKGREDGGQCERWWMINLDRQDTHKAAPSQKSGVTWPSKAMTPVEFYFSQLQYFVGCNFWILAVLAEYCLGCVIWEVVVIEVVAKVGTVCAKALDSTDTEGSCTNNYMANVSGVNQKSFSSLRLILLLLSYKL